MKEPITTIILKNEVALDKKCWNCDGGRCVMHNNDGLWTDGVCDICKDSGHILTEAGQAVIDLVERHCIKKYIISE